MAAAMENRENYQSGQIHSPEEMLKEVRHFVNGCRYDSKSRTEDLTRSALLLIRTLPSTRHTVLEYLCTVFHDGVNFHLMQREHNGGLSGNNGADFEAIIADVQSVLLGLVKSNPDAWAPIISAVSVYNRAQWSIELLGHISSRYAKHHGVTQSSCLNELLQLWMTCPPTKSLIEIASECFASMVSGSPDVCVDALLETSVKHSPHFDWVVAHIGSCFPQTIITRVLMCGLKDFCAHGNSEYDVTMPSEENMPKMASVVGILGHLAGQHGHDINRALLTLFEESLAPSNEDMRRSTIPFLLHLASMSPLLLRVITTDIMASLNTTVLNKLAEQFSKRKPSLGNDTDYLVNLVVHLVVKSDVGAVRVLQFLLDTMSMSGSQASDLNTGIHQICSMIMERLLLDLQRVVNRRRNDQNVDVPFLLALQPHISTLCKQLLDAPQQRCVWLWRLLSCVAVYCGQSCAIDILCYILKHATSVTHLGVFVQVQQSLQLKYPDVLFGVLSAVTTNLQSQTPVSLRNLLNNLRYLVRWEMECPDNSLTRCCLKDTLKDHLVALSSLLYHKDVLQLSCIIELLTLIGLPPQCSVSTLTHLSCAIVTAFFFILSVTDSQDKQKLLQPCKLYLASLCKHSTNKRMILRFLLEGAFSKEHALLFCANVDPIVSAPPKEESLLVRNQAASLSIQHSHATVFHAGVIGQGLRPPARLSPYSKEERFLNGQSFLDVLRACSCCEPTNQEVDVVMETDSADMSGGLCGGQQQLTADTARILATLVVELVCPDVMFNTILWPEEEFIKVTVERDLIIRRKFDDNPLLWEILELLSEGRGGLCHCSVLLRSVTATLLVHWESCREKSATSSPKQLSSSCRLIECMRKGDVLPAPLCHVGELFPHISPYEIYLLLQNIWRYMRENPPLPVSDEEQEILVIKVCGDSYLQVLRNILHTNIDKLGHLFARFSQPSTSI